MLPEREHHARRTAHQRRVEHYTADFLARRHEGHKHPVEDFLFTYYSHSPGQLARWHPGAGVVLEGAGASEQAQWRFYTQVADGTEAGGVAVDVAGFLAQRESMVGFARRLLSATAAKPAQLGCFGLHEWAMVYRSVQHGQRHDQVPLRLGAAGTDEVVEAMNIRCSHFDAYRFYTPSAKPLNALEPTRQKQVEMEQPGCLHANMDLYKWAYKLIPAVGSDLLMDCFDLAWRIRELDMRASPYDLRGWGYEPVRIEEPSGRAEYARAQKAFSEEAQTLRERILAQLDRIEGLAPASRV
ncbi:3-methyladenine DNA glycosylase [Nesterenkonia sp. LY-0111]|uniref:3-methyladenine DNA glycosylase n=1 Tax=Nesterenkonia aerolata TaxID=3074079 RepID=A0ABU2DPB2_9MICC|nr:3-methyladenine DNA glycosylase [Nesterenkonia sp. LY-0111]